MQCPSCGHSAADGPECPRCGVIFAKLGARPRPPRGAAPPPTSPPTAPAPAADGDERRGVALNTVVTGVLVLALGLWFYLDRRRPPPAPQAAPAQAPPARAAGAAPPPAPRAPALAEAPPPPSLAPPSLPADSAPLEAQGGVRPEDVERANELIRKAQRGAYIGVDDLRTMEELASRYPDEPHIADVQVAILTTLAASSAKSRSFTEAKRLLRQAVKVRPQNVDVRRILVSVLTDSGDLAEAEAAAREALQVAPRDADLLFRLGYALFRQDQNREAIETLQASLAAGETPQARGLLDRLLKEQKDERGMAERQLAHFHVRYDGEAHEDVGREILRQLERHYATLVRTFDHQPATAIAVILFTGQQYYDATGAPTWSGGQFDHTDGRIRIPIGGLTTSLTPDMDGTLIHELAHAFIHDISRGNAPRAVHEGVAQYVEGQRIASRYSPRDLALIADGRAGGVGGYYASALAFVEYLVSVRGTGGIQEMLRAIGETGSADAGFQRVYGANFAGTQRAWRERIRQQYGS